MNKTSPIARILAAVALVGAVVLVFVVLSSATGDDDGGNKGKNNQSKTAKKDGKKSKPKTKAKTYEVQEGDTLTGIANKTGISVEVIEELNPDLDPQALTLGQELKLR